MLGHFFSEHMDERYILERKALSDSRRRDCVRVCVLKRFPDSIILARCHSFQGHSQHTWSHGGESRAIYTGSMIGVVPPKV
ncbi:hypothetical protein CSHISOI_07606 [Colletotrichum shisoi]|uniref:Uncharacterized protein n=1 Tax=Colletotrichum shisoi TaxID=2078593 RepID=A0A5Q4BLJ4_9PEZI|nr:hypothetical protein CSHISOI_07606 [Colletotrichum shisoi]